MASFVPPIVDFKEPVPSDIDVSQSIVPLNIAKIAEVGILHASPTRPGQACHAPPPHTSVLCMCEHICMRGCTPTSPLPPLPPLPRPAWTRRQNMGCVPSEVDLYGSVKAKINLSVRDRLKDTENGYVHVCVYSYLCCASISLYTRTHILTAFPTPTPTGTTSW